MKFIKFLILAMVFIFVSTSFLSIVKFRDKTPDVKDPEQTTITVTPEVPDELLFYTADGNYFTEDELCHLDNGTLVYYTEGTTTRFAKIFTDFYSGSSTIDFNYDPSRYPEYSEEFCYKVLNNEGQYDVYDHFDLVIIKSNSFGSNQNIGDEVRLIAVFLEFENCTNPETLLAGFVADGYFDNEHCGSGPCGDPSAPEGPSEPEADLDVPGEPEAPEGPSEPQVDPMIPEGPSDPQIDPGSPDAPGAE